MRITNSTLLRTYDRSLKRLGANKFRSENKIFSGREFNRASESPLNAAKALTIRKQMYHTEQYMENLDVADKFYTEAETSLLQISEVLTNVRETIIYACNTTKEPEVDLSILAQQLETKASEMVSVFNTNSAERAIFGGESNSAEPFTLALDENGIPSTVLYHGVPVNAYTDHSSFPYSNEIYVDIGIGMIVDQQTQEIDPQSALKISFNGAQVTGCGFDEKKNLVTRIYTTALNSKGENTVDIYANDTITSVTFEGNTLDAIREAINNTFTAAGYTADKIPQVSNNGTLTMPNGSAVYIPQNVRLNLTDMEPDAKYSIDIFANERKTTVSFVGNDPEAIQAAIDEAFRDQKNVPQIDENGVITLTETDKKGNVTELPVYLYKTTGDYKNETPSYDNNDTFSNNYIQLTLDAAKALRDNDIAYANACIDRIISASENLLVEIANLGNSEEYIEFNTNRFETLTLNLKERQKDLEASDMESEITLYKTYEAIYNAALQMSSSVIPNSIFNYMK